MRALGPRTRYAGEPKPPVTAGPPPWPMQPLPEPTIELAMPCSYSWAKPLLESSPRALVLPNSGELQPAPPRNRAAGALRRRPLAQKPSAVRSEIGALD